MKELSSETPLDTNSVVN